MPGRIGGGGGGRHPGRNCNPEQRKNLGKKQAIGLPTKDLKNIGARLLSRAKNYKPEFEKKEKKIEYSDPYQGMGQPEEDDLQQPSDAEGSEQQNEEHEEEEEQQQQQQTTTTTGAASISEYAAIGLRARQAQAQFDSGLSLAGGASENNKNIIGAPMDLSDAMKGTHNTHQELSLPKFASELKNTIDVCDVLLEVLDCRDPMGCRLTSIERHVESQFGDKKTMIVVLNKIDMVPQEVLDQWVNYFNNQKKIVLGFCAKSEGSNANHRRTRSIRGNACVSEMFRVLRSIGRGEQLGEAGLHGGARKHITVGVIGYPNVGKSSIINALRRKDVTGVGNTPGFTTGNQEVDLRKDIKIHDCPGVVIPGQDSGDVVLRNAVKLDQLDNPLLAVSRLYERCDPGLLNQVYQVNVRDTLGKQQHRKEVLKRGSDEFNREVEEFVRQVGVRRGRVRQGGRVDENETAKMILKDWNDGRIGYFTLPPEEDSMFTNFGVSSSSALANQDDTEEDGGKVLLTSFSRALTADGMPTFHLTPSTSTMNSNGMQQAGNFGSLLGGSSNSSDGNNTSRRNIPSSVQVGGGIGAKKRAAGLGVGYGRAKRGRTDFLGEDEAPNPDAEDEDEIM